MGMIESLSEEQKRLSQEVRIENLFSQLSLIGAADCASDGEYIYCAFLLFSYERLKLLAVKTAKRKIDFPYIPGFLSYREKDAYLECYQKLETRPDVILFDGQGIAHPRRLGLASHIGVLLNQSTIGCAKSRLLGNFHPPGKRRGSFSPLWENKELIGYVLRTRDGVSPVFVSPGHRIDFVTAREIVLKTTLRYRIPEPLRLAHILSKSLKGKI